MSTNTLNDTLVHSCNDDGCNGMGLNGLHVKCSKCSSKIFLECIQKRSGSIALLKISGVITSKDTFASDGVENAQKIFNRIFDHNSPFAIYCEFCRLSTEPSMRDKLKPMEAAVTAKQIKIEKLEAKVLDLQQKVHNASASNTVNNDVEQAKIIELGTKVIEAVKQITGIGNEIGTEAPIITNQHRSENTTIKSNHKIKNMAKVIPVNGVYSIHVSRLKRDETADGVTAAIIANSNIIPESFNVDKIQIRRYRGKARKFSSFKISTLSQDVCNKIISHDGWDSNCIVKPFTSIVKDQNNVDSLVSNRNGQTQLHRQSSQNNAYAKYNNNKNRNNDYRNRNNHGNLYRSKEYRHKIRRNHQQNNRWINRQTFNRNRNPNYWQNGDFNLQQQISQNPNIHQQQFSSIPFRQQHYYYPPVMIPLHQQQQQIHPQTQMIAHSHSQPQPIYQ